LLPPEAPNALIAKLSTLGCTSQFCALPVKSKERVGGRQADEPLAANVPLGQARKQEEAPDVENVLLTQSAQAICEEIENLPA